MFVKAVYYREKKTVHYFDENGDETLYIGGSFAWRTNNPGNLARPYRRVITTHIGYAQRISDPKSIFLIFPDRATGDAERIRLLKEEYGKKSIEKMIHVYAPPTENNTERYIQFVTRASGASRTTKLNELSKDQFDKLVAAMRTHEGQTPGQIRFLGKPKSAEIKDALNQPLASQTIALKGGSDTIKIKTDPYGALPPMYPKLFEDNVSLYLDSTEDLIGNLESASSVKSFTFVAPYFSLKSNAEVHETKEESDPVIHIVKQGQTLGKIAERYGVTLDALASTNRIKDYDKIFARQHLRIPPRSATGSKTPTPESNTPKENSPVSPAKSEAQKPLPPPVAKPSLKPVSNATVPAVHVDSQRTDKKHPVTVLSTPALEASGPQWWSRFQGDNRVDALQPPFREKVKKFRHALDEAGIPTQVNSVYRPIERSYLMYWAFMICRGADVTKIPPWPGVNIDWAHRKPDGTPDIAKAKIAAQQMCVRYQIHPEESTQKVGKPAQSNHNKFLAIDMTPRNYIGKIVKDASGNLVKVTSFKTLAVIGATYDVNFYTGEKMHWSYNGR